MNESPRISVVMAVHNGAPAVADAVRSILAQTFTNFELVIVDDGSTDSTPDDLAIFSRQDDRLFVHRQLHSGPIAALIAATRYATGDFIARLDPIDIAQPRRLETQLALLDAHPNVAAVGTHVGYVESPRATVTVPPVPTTNDAVAFELLFGPAMADHTMLIRRDVFDAVGGYDPAAKSMAGYDLSLRLLSRARLVNLPEPLVHRRRRALDNRVTVGHVGLADAARARFLSGFLGREVTPAMAAMFRRSQSAFAMFSARQRREMATRIREVLAAMETAGMIGPAAVESELAAKLAAIAACRVSARRAWRSMTHLAAHSGALAAGLWHRWRHH